MQIGEVISKIKEYHKADGIEEATTRDKVLYGKTAVECTGIVTTCWATIEVIEKAHSLGANFIICHEALFWNHGDHTKWLEEMNNRVFLKKKNLLDEYQITVWRDHDYIHSGIPVGTSYMDGIFYGFAKEMQWESYMVEDGKLKYTFEIPETPVEEIARQVVSRFGLEGLKVIGSRKTMVKKVSLILHVTGNPSDNNIIEKVEKEEIDLLFPLEVVDYTLSEYVRDSAMCGRDRTMLVTGHFNGEEPGMKYMAQYLHDVVKEPIPCTYVQSGDMYHYYTKKGFA